MSVNEETSREPPEPEPDSPLNEGASTYSNAQNFLSHLQTGVDVRTGDFTCAMSLPALEANRLQGPTVQLGLGFSSQLQDDVGYGTGWALTGITTYHPATKTLVLSTGERFLADQTVSEFTFMDRKLVTFHMRRVAGTNFEYLVTHKNGVIERLSTLNGVARTAVPVEIRSPDGRCVFLTFTQAQVPKLLTVSDEAGLLLSIERSTSFVHVTLHPEGAQPLLFSLVQVSKKLSRLRLPPALGDVGWTFTYKTIGELLYVTHVVLPTGGEESVAYTEKGHQCLPGAPTTHVPYVRLHTRTPGLPQPPIVTSYVQPP